MHAIDTNVRDEFLSFNLGAEQYAIDILRVREIREHTPVTRIANSARAMLGIFDLRGAIVPVFDMRTMLGMSPAAPGGNPVVIILDIDARPAGIVVDAVCQVVGLEEGAVKPLPPGTTNVQDACIRGAVSLGDEMLIVLDIARLMNDMDARVEEAA